MMLAIGVEINPRVPVIPRGALGLAWRFRAPPVLAESRPAFSHHLHHGFAGLVTEPLKNFDDLVENLQGFCNEPRETVVQMMAESGARLGEDWRRSKPQGQVEVTAWYSRNARLYLYNNCQHHLLYKHIVYTLDLLRLARVRVLDFGGG